MNDGSFVYVYWALEYIIIWRMFILERAIFVISVHTLLAIFILDNYGQIFFFLSQCTLWEYLC